MIRLEEDFTELEKSIARQIILSVIMDSNWPTLVVGDLETGILLMLSDQESKAKH